MKTFNMADRAGTSFAKFCSWYPKVFLIFSLMYVRDFLSQRSRPLAIVSSRAQFKNMWSWTPNVRCSP